ncbi:MAG TPA: histidine kinase [Nocardioides sp.]|nr:histidine kinase [Nocardioides sp.]
MGTRLRPAHWALLLVAVTAEAGSVVLSWGREPAWDTLVYAVYALANMAAGLLVLARHPRHRIGILLVVNGLLQAVVTDLAQGYALTGTPHHWPTAAAVDLVASSSWAVSGAVLPAILVLFPDGTLPTSGRIWPWVLPLGCLGSLLTLAGWATGPRVAAQMVGGTNPVHAPGVPSELLYWLGFPGLTGSLLLGVLAMVQRMRAATGVERQQLKWMVFAAGVMVATLVPSSPLFDRFVVVRIADALVLTVLPLAALAAIWRYRLYDIELIVSRTVLYACVTAVLGGVFAALVVALGVVFGNGSPAATAGATLVVALAFRPLRDRLQKLVDRAFDRGRYDALGLVTDFMTDLRAGRREPEDVAQVLAEATARLGSPERQAAVRPSLEQEASLAVEMVRLRAELREQLAEVRDSRRRIVEAAESERHRIERDLHDGAQQRLIAIGLALRHVQHGLGDADAGTRSALDAAVQEVTDTIGELREIARGIRPGVLEEGLESALRDLVQRTPLPVDVVVPPRRFAAAVETAAYFIACEGVTNAAKHGDATRIDLHIEEVAGTLVVRVQDDGVGGATLSRGGGLVGVSDRVAALGGRLSIRSEPGQGTTLLAELSCAS